MENFLESVGFSLPHIRGRMDIFLQQNAWMKMALIYQETEHQIV